MFWAENVSLTGYAMAIFGKLFAQKAPKSEHPLGSEENLAALLADMPVLDPTRTLQETGEWLDDFQRFAEEIDVRAMLRAALRLDDLAFAARQKLLERYFDSRHREHFSDMTWNDMERSARRALLAYHYCMEAVVNNPPKEGLDDDYTRDLKLAAIRSLKAWSLRKKLLRFRYRGPEAADWRQLHAILSLAGRFGGATEAVLPYAEDADKLSPLQQYLVAVYLELAPLTNLAAEQIEVLDRLLAANANALELLSAAGPGSTDKIDIAGSSGPLPMDKPVAADVQWRYLSRPRLRPAMTKLAMGLRQAPLVPESLKTSGIGMDMLHRLINMLLLHWAEAPPHRAAERRPGHDMLKAVTGFELARRVIAYSDFARSGKSVDYEGTDYATLFERNRFGGRASLNESEETPAQATEKKIANPLDVLERLELAGDKQMMESWTLADLSETGLGAIVPGLKTKYQIGSLVCLRYADGIEWHIGIVRRIGRDPAGNVSIGLATLDWPSSSAHVKPVDDNVSAWNAIEEVGHGYVDAILVSSDSNQLVLPRGAFVAQLRLHLRSGDSLRQVCLAELVEAGSDFELVRFVPANYFLITQ